MTYRICDEDDVMAMNAFIDQHATVALGLKASGLRGDRLDAAIVGAMAALHDLPDEPVPTRLRLVHDATNDETGEER